MPKVLLVEDDNNLREIFQMRLAAEGYATATAADGEEGLVVAMKEKPDLIIADVMMPKLSGFEMVENLRATPEMKDTKVIMMTALGQAEDQARGEKLGVVKYLVKSQVTLEDFARVVKEVLGPGDPQAAAAAQNTGQATNKQESEATMPDDTSTNPAPAPSDSPAPAEPAAPGASPSGDDQQSSADEQAVVNNQVDNFVNNAPGATSGGDSGATPPAGGGDSGSSPAPDAGSTSTDSAPEMPPSSEPPAAPTEPPASTEGGSSTPPSDSTL